MPDEFPTLEVVALIGVIAALVGMLQLRRGLSEIPRLRRALEQALRGGDLNEARALCGQAEGAAFARIGLSLVEALERDPAPDQKELSHVIAAARKRATKAAQRGRGRDLVVAAVLIGAGAYAFGAALGVGLPFYGLIAAALCVTALGPVLRRAMLEKLVEASDGLLGAARAYLALKKTPSPGACAECGGLASVRIGSPALDALGDLGLKELIVCQTCGLVRGRIERPEAIRLDEARGVQALVTEAAGESSATQDGEHDG
jgi:hypothetical protein